MEKELNDTIKKLLNQSHFYHDILWHLIFSFFFILLGLYLANTIEIIFIKNDFFDFSKLDITISYYVQSIKDIVAPLYPRLMLILIFFVAIKSILIENKLYKISQTEIYQQLIKENSIDIQNDNLTAVNCLNNLINNSTYKKTPYSRRGLSIFSKLPLNKEMLENINISYNPKPAKPFIFIIYIITIIFLVSICISSIISGIIERQNINPVNNLDSIIDAYYSNTNE